MPFRKTLLRLLGMVFLLVVISTLIHFPYHTDVVSPPTGAKAYKDFYQQIYSAPQTDAPEPEEDTHYVSIAQQFIKNSNIVARIQAFVAQYGLEDKRVLDVGSGTGYLQDSVKNYVGLDISPTAQRFYHKSFVQASATDIPFPEGTFDAVWSVAVLEHVPTPEQALVEIRRVTKDGGLLFLAPAWNCTPWAAEGYAERPYRDFGLKGKLIKASLPIQQSTLFRNSYLLPIRILRESSTLLDKPTRFLYTPLTPNYTHYWTADSDAVNSFDHIELKLWFTSRGDECLNCSLGPFSRAREVIIRVRKRSGAA